MIPRMTRIAARQPKEARILRPSAWIFLALVASLSCPAAMAETLSGTVSYRERMALPPGAQVEVRLLDVSRADAPAALIAETLVDAEGQPPIPFALTYDPALLAEGHRYAVRARILRGDQVLFRSTTVHPVFTEGAERTVEISLERAAAAVPPDLAGSWLAEDIGRAGVIDRLRTVLVIAADGAVSGSGGCNRITGRATISGETVAFGPIASTDMLCPPAVMDQETKFLALLGQVRSWRADPERKKLLLLDADGTAIMTFARD
ncbi:MAG: hypothetical protein DI556_20370 [Rhodovulum sulfidophilum]|uniref:DUF306 domain-containing protein n=1 Tax=Rhodovulum sulfidophilum TaxID=35806 RepID=A0A2W5N060_RHOSU|nr:MAG: hypothetical protein DI556_20370 [Rhodovulum sulfidophilum]